MNLVQQFAKPLQDHPPETSVSAPPVKHLRHLSESTMACQILIVMDTIRTGTSTVPASENAALPLRNDRSLLKLADDFERIQARAVIIVRGATTEIDAAYPSIHDPEPSQCDQWVRRIEGKQRVILRDHNGHRRPSSLSHQQRINFWFF